MEWITICIISIAFSFYLVFNFRSKDENKNSEKKRFQIREFDKLSVILFITISLTGIVIFAISKIYNHSLMHRINMAVLSMLLIPIVYKDFKEQIIPNKYILIGLTIRFLTLSGEIVFSGDSQYNSVLTYLIGFIFGGGIFLLSSFILKNSVGMGDVKLFAVIGFFVGLSGIFSVLFYTLLVSAIVGIVLLLLKRKTKKDSIPLAPFSLIGVVVSILLGI